MEHPSVDAGHPMNAIGWATATVAMWGSAPHLAFAGFAWESLGAVLGGTGTLIFALVAASKEIRGWLDRRILRQKQKALVSTRDVGLGPDSPGGVGNVSVGSGQ